MASSVRVLVVGGRDGLADMAMDQIRDLENRWSRFLPTSDTTRLNLAEGRPVVVDVSTVVLVTALVEGWRLTGGRFDPSMLPALIAAGYRSSIDDRTRTSVLPADPRSGGDLGLVEVDVATSQVRLPRGLVVDPGGVGKGLAADMVVERLLREGAEGALVSIGGDLAAAGCPPDGEEWSIRVDDPWQPTEPLMFLHIDRGGIATSSTLSRRIGPAGSAHHLIDPGTGRPAATDLATATVIAATAWRAEVLATATMLGGSENALAYFEGQGVDGIAVGLDGTVLVSPRATASGVFEDRP